MEETPRVALVCGIYHVNGLALVGIGPHRDDAEAAELAGRIAREPAYLGVCNELHVPGIIDLRSTLQQ